MHGTIDLKKTAGMEKFSLSETSDFKRRASGGKNLDTKRIWQTIL